MVSSFHLTRHTLVSLTHRRAGMDVYNLQRSKITDQKFGSSDDLFNDHYSLVIERRVVSLCRRGDGRFSFIDQCSLIIERSTVAQRFLTQESGVGSQETGVLAQENAGSNSPAGPVSWAITDNTGSVVDVVANGGRNAILDHIVYDSFGNTVSQTNSADAMLMGFDGYVYDAETGLYYANARYYSPSLGRFISQDPTGFSAGDSNLYRFVGNHPTYATDPTGLYEGGSAFTQGTGSYGSGSGGSSSLIAPWLNLGSGTTSTGSSPVSLTSPTSAFGGGSYGSGGGYSTGNNALAFNLGSGPLAAPSSDAAALAEEQRTALFLGQLGYQDIQNTAVGATGATGVNPMSDLAALENTYGSAGLGNVNLPVPQGAWLPSSNNTLVPVRSGAGFQTAVQIAAANGYQQQSLINQGGISQAYPEQYFIPGPGLPTSVGDMVIEDASRTIGGTLLGETATQVAQTGVFNITAHDIANELSSANNITVPMAGQPGNSILDWNLQQAAGNGDALTAEQLRNTPGIAAASGPHVPAFNNWLDASTPAAIPAQATDSLVGQQFSSFGDLRAAIWRTIAGNNDLSGGFNARNLGNMKSGYAPFAPTAFQVNASDAGMRFNLDHVNPIELGGAVYDLSNLQIVSPLIHNELH